MTTAPRTLSIGIAGAGNAGLAAAIAFARQGHDVHVFEKHSQLTALGAIAGHAMASVFQDTLQAGVEQAQRVQRLRGRDGEDVDRTA